MFSNTRLSLSLLLLDLSYCWGSVYTWLVFEVRICVTSSDHWMSENQHKGSRGLSVHTPLHCHLQMSLHTCYVTLVGAPKVVQICCGWCKMQCTEVHMGTASSINRRDANTHVNDMMQIRKSKKTMCRWSLIPPCRVFSSPFTYVLNINALPVIHSFNLVKYFFRRLVNSC